MAISEMLVIDDDIRKIIRKDLSITQLKEIARSKDMNTLYESGIRKIEAGVTSLSEVLSVTLGEE